MRIGYARVSTGEQKLDLQRDALEASSWETTHTDMTSGATSSRPELDKCLEDLREGDTLVVWRLGRFGRSLKDLITKIEALDERGVEFVSLTEGIDTTTAQGRLAFHLFGAPAEFERKIARERRMAGIRAARKRGRVGGRPRRRLQTRAPDPMDPSATQKQLVCTGFVFTDIETAEGEVLIGIHNQELPR
jgi:DNA invertase Pin-like site-specific DNA recombinase